MELTMQEQKKLTMVKAQVSLKGEQPGRPVAP
jgi:hypothetical protein